MLDLEEMLRPALTSAGGNDVALAMPYELPDRIVRDLMAEGLLCASIANSADAATTDPSCAGWWSDKARCRMVLRRTAPKTLLIAGIDPKHMVSSHLLLEARLKGVRRIVTASHLGTIIEDLNVASDLDARIDQPAASPRIGSMNFEVAFRLMYELTGDVLRLDPLEFDPDTVMLSIGGLGPGGAERQAAYTAAGIQRSKAFDAHVLCTYVDPPADFFRPLVEKAGAKVIKVEREPQEMNFPAIAEAIRILDERYEALRFGEIFREIVRYAAAIRKLKPATVHNWMDYCNVMCGTAAKLVGVPSILLSGRSVAPDHFRIFQPYMNPGYRALLSNEHIVFLNNSRAGAEDYERWLRLPSRTVRVIHNGFDFPEIDAVAARTKMREEYGIAESAKLVGSILRFSEEKRPKLAIDMAHAIYARDSSIRFLFCGGGVLLEEMRSYVASLGLKEVIQLPGLETRNWEALAAMDCFVLTSRMEGLPNVLVEAQAIGLPVVCTGVGGMGETFLEGVTGVAVKDATPESLASAVLGILGDMARRTAMSSRARNHAPLAFGVDRMISETIDAYAQAAREPQTAATLKVPA